MTLTLVISALAFGVLSPVWSAPKKVGSDKAAAMSSPPAPPLTNEDVAATPASGARDFLGTYVGAFGAHRITVCLQNLIGQTTVNGYSITAGNERAFSGAITVDNVGVLAMLVREPGDHPQDGVFDLVYRTDTKHLTGTWKGNDQRLAPVSFDLERRDFHYNPKLGSHPETSTRALKTSDVENLHSDELRIMRNEIYARHGYTFRLKDMRDHFEQQDWYMPISMNVSTQLTALEEKNAELIKRYENYGANYYDAFGR